MGKRKPWFPHESEAFDAYELDLMRIAAEREEKKRKEQARRALAEASPSLLVNSLLPIHDSVKPNTVERSCAIDCIQACQVALGKVIEGERYYLLEDELVGFLKEATSIRSRLHWLMHRIL
jgi:hypothetical protein